MKAIKLPAQSDKQLQALDELYRTTKDVRLRQRAQMILLAAEKQMVACEVAEIVRQDEQTVRRWFKRYMVEGIEGLTDAPHPGGQRTVTEEYCSKLVASVRRRPRSLGQPYSIWSLQRLAGLWQYRAKIQFVERLPIPDLTIQQESDLAAIAEEITGLARSRYQGHEDFRQTLLNEFDGDEISTRVALYRWWEFDDEKALSDEINRRFGQEIPLNKRSEWRGFLHDQKAEHQRLTDAIITLEIRMNDIVYDAFDLTLEERQLIEETTKYPYGEV